MGAKEHKANIKRMNELIAQLKEADIAYYRDDKPIMSDRDYDVLTDELKRLEQNTGLTLSGSPTQTVSGEIMEELTPVRHTRPMLSADKTKSMRHYRKAVCLHKIHLQAFGRYFQICYQVECKEFKESLPRLIRIQLPHAAGRQISGVAVRFLQTQVDFFKIRP